MIYDISRISHPWSPNDSFDSFSKASIKSSESSRLSFSATGHIQVGNVTELHITEGVACISYAHKFCT